MNDKKLEATRIFKAPIEKVFAAWTDADQMKKWYAPEGMTTPSATSDARAGGAYTISMQDEKSGTHTGSGVYKVFNPPHRFVCSWKWEGDDRETTVTVEFQKVSETQTKVTLAHEGFVNTQEQEMHQKGWMSTFNKLEKYLAA